MESRTPAVSCYRWRNCARRPVPAPDLKYGRDRAGWHAGPRSAGERGRQCIPPAYRRILRPRSSENSGGRRRMYGEPGPNHPDPSGRRHQHGSRNTARWGNWRSMTKRLLRRRRRRCGMMREMQNGRRGGARPAYRWQANRLRRGVAHTCAARRRKRLVRAVAPAAWQAARSALKPAAQL